ncbi:unnamed protein product, partial [Polarella glacialis]
VLAWSDSGAPRHEIHKAVAAAAALGGQLLQIPPGRSGTRSDLAAQLSTALPKLLDSVLNGGLEESVEVMEGWHLDGCLYAMSVTEALVAAGCPRASNSEVQDTWHDQRQAVVSELKRRRQALSERSVRFWLARVFEPGLLAWSDKLPALLVDELLGASEEGRGTAAEARRTADAGEDDWVTEGDLPDQSEAKLDLPPGYIGPVAATLRDCAFLLERVHWAVRRRGLHGQRQVS